MNGNIATTVETSKNTRIAPAIRLVENIDTVDLKCSMCNDKVTIPLKTYDNLLNNKDWHGEWIPYTNQELAAKYSPQEMTSINAMTENDQHFYKFKIVTKNTVYCSLKCNCLFTDD